MIGRTNPRSGMGLDYRVFKGTSAPLNPRDGDIWIKTAVPITQVEFGTAWTDAAVGSVAITGTLGGDDPTDSNAVLELFNRKKFNAINREKVSLTQCRQVHGSAGNWEQLDAYRYFGGTWVQFSYAFDGVIFDPDRGGDISHVTGGWRTNDSGARINVSSGQIAFLSQAGGVFKSASTNNAILLNDFRYFKVTASGYDSNYCHVGLTRAQNRGFAAVVAVANKNTYTIDIRSLAKDVPYYITVDNDSGINGRDTFVYKAWLER